MAESGPQHRPAGTGQPAVPGQPAAPMRPAAPVRPAAPPVARPAGRLVMLATTPRVAPGLLSLRAWDTLRAASKVLAGSPGHPQLAALGRAGVTWELAPPAGAAERARWLVALTAAADGPVVWLASHAGDEDLLTAIAEAGAGLLRGGGAEVLQGACDLPGSRLLDLVTTMDTLRARCPWDARQTHQSLAPHLLEEAYEAIEALEDDDPQALRDELGDVLLQVMFHARIAAERDDSTGFTIDDVADAIVAKLVRRHPHVFGDVRVSGADEVRANWAAIKAAERADRGDGPGSVLDSVPFGQPALSLAAQLLGRAAGAGYPGEAISGDGDGADDLGARLFALAAQARAAGFDPELELRAAARTFAGRVRAWERENAAELY